jgi:hypothetical protein
MTKFCKDCRHVLDRTVSQAWWECGLTKITRLTDGEDSYRACAIARVTPTQCGTEARWFEPIEQKAESDEFLYADEKEPDRYRDENERLDDPRHDQCRNGKFVP